MQKDERRRPPRRKARGVFFGDPERGERGAGMAAQRAKGRTWSVYYGDGREPGDVAPTPP